MSIAIESIYPLSPMQQGMLFHSLYAPESGVYFEQMTLSLKGNVNVAAFESAWQKVVNRYSILRTFFVWENRPNPLQVVLKQVDLPWNSLNWRELSLTEQQQQLSELLQTQREQGFSFNQAPLMRCTLIQLSDDAYKFIWSHHHILIDGWCLPIIFKDILSFYEADLAGETCYLPTPRPYRDYIAWLNSQDKEAAADFWRQTLHGFSAPTPLRVNKKPVQNQQQNSNYCELELRLSAEISRELQSIAQQHRVTLSTIVQAAWALLLSRYSGETDVVFGVTVSGRTGSLSGVENMVGLLINTLPLRLFISPQEQLIPWLQQIQQLMSELQHYSYTPLVDIQALSEVPGGIPLFESIVVFENYPVDSSLLNEGGSLQLSEIEGFEQTNYPLTVVAVPGDELLVKISYDTVGFEEDTIGRMLGHLQTIFSAIVENPVVTVGELPLLSEAERHQLLVEWNDTASVYPTDKCIHQLFEEQVEKTPHTVAVVFDNQQLTYLKLNQRANQLARHLQSLGVGSEVLVGICVERSVEMVIGLLGILKAGGAYVPLDPNYPLERLSYMLADSGVEVLLTQQQLLSCLPSHTARVICLDTDWGVIKQHSQDNLDPGVCSDNLAYVIYTSGSTGQPKGVMNTHQGIHNRLLWMQQSYQLTSSDRVVQKTPFSFDVSVWEFFWPLLTGASIVVVLPEGHKDTTYLVNLISQQQITTIHFVPSMLQVFLLEPNSGNCSCLKRVFCSGEALPFELTQRFFSKLQCELHNLYGPTEAAIDVTFWPCLPQENLQIVPIGRPINNIQIYILDEYLQPVPIGVPGELYIGGDGLARGYLNRPELTLEKFIPNPFCDSKSERLYKTGDLARHLIDGNIEYLGRIDNQVKIRGFRIELGEIEAVLNTHLQIQQAVVIAKEEIPGNKRLVAYVVPGDESLTTNQLCEFLLRKLPEYMVPSAFVLLDTLPLTPNGKIDRKALPTPDDVSRETEYVAPRTPSEEIIANIFATVLSVKNVGIHENFFTLGGHSLLATQLISQLRLAFTVEIPLRAVFESPTVTQLDQTITQLRTQERGLTLPPIQPIEGDTELLPLSWAQERLWFLNQLEGSTATYNIPGAVHITGNLDINALQQALSEIVRRHSILRTSIQSVNGTPRQVIHPQATVNMKVVNLQQLLATEREAVQNQLALEEAITPFELENAPLIRCSCVQLSATEYVLLLTMHHIVSDAWSMGVFIRELSALYQTFCDGVPSPLPELPIQYADFAVWQRQWLSGEVLDTQLNYWLSQLHGAPSLLQLPTDRPRPVAQTYQGRTQSFTVVGDLTQKLQTLSRESGTTLFMTLQAAFATLLYRYSGQSDILVGTPIANRNRSEIEPLIGFFVNTLVLRTQFEGNPSIKSLLSQVRETTLKAYEHQDVPFEQVVEALQPQRSLSHSPLFQVMFELQNTPISKLELSGVTWCELDQESTIAKFDLTVSMLETDQGLVGEWEYNTDLFDGSTIERMAGHFQSLLSAIVENPQLAVDEIPLLTEQERHQLLVEWNATKSEYPQHKCIHQLFEEQVHKTPLSVAVVFENQQLTYLQLNQRANQLAHHLRSLGVGPEVLVGICVERGVEMVVGVLGILKAGGAYIPLDPNYPNARLSQMLNDSQISMVLTQQNLHFRLSEYPGHVLNLDTQWQVISQECEDNPVSDVQADNLAYVIYTSGSTGLPKGVMISHASLVNAYWGWEQAYQLQSHTSSHLQMASFSFDVFSGDMVRALCSGGKLVLCPRELLLMPEQLYELMRKEEVDCGEFVPVVIRNLMRYLEKTGQNLDFLRVLVVGSDSWYVQEYEQLQRLCAQNTCVINSYGVSETTIDSCYFESTALTLPSDALVPIGRPLSNIQIYILDPHLEPVPIGVPGELYIGGAGLARGYLNRPELSVEKFIKNPLCGSKSERLYKTGDLARYLSDGNIEYLGRIDNQVKIRGFRIELGEIEAVLNTHAQIQEAVVIATEDILQNKRLLAYVVPSDESLTIHQLREFLNQQLPEYMVPNGFVTLDTIPLTPNGKIDRKALSTYDGEITRETQYVTPRTPSQEIITNIFAAILGVQNVGIHDNFFTLGGHSLLATQLISQLRLAFTVEIPLRAVFESPTVTQLDQTITQLRTQERGLTLPPIQPIEGDTELLPLSWAQERLWFLNQLEGSTATYNIPGAVHITGNLDINALQQALSEIVRRHSILRTSIQSVNGTPRQVIYPQAIMNVNVVDLQQLPATERETVQNQLALEEANTPFNLEIAPLIRCSVLQLSVRECVLLLTMHHIISDAWSMEVFIQELSVLYQASCDGVPSPLPELPIQYADFAVWQKQWLSGEVLDTQLNYWRSQLHGAPSLLQLPTDRSRPLVQTYQGRTHSWTIDTDLTQKLQTLSRESGTTLFMTLLAVFATLLYRYSGQSDILVGTPIANRNRSEIESLIGFFVNTLVLRTRFEANPSFENLFAQVRETTLQAYEHQDVPFEQVVEALQPQRSLSHSPLFQVMFAWQNTPMSEIELPGVTLCELDQESTIAKFDLTLSMSETDQGLVGEWEYNTDLFDRSTIERMVSHFQNLLSAIVENPQLAVGEIPLLSEAERHQLLVEWNDTKSEYPQDKCIHQLFEEQVEKTPLSVAVVFENQQLTYLQLNQRANQLAHHLLSLGVGPEVLVGICVERSVEMVVGLLGILKAGGAYVPLDPNYPLERLSYMLADSGIEVFLTQNKWTSQLLEHQAQVICLDSDWEKIALYSQENPTGTKVCKNLAYIIYTSGSTGKSKGVMITHQALTRFTQTALSEYEITASDRVLQFASINFDAAVEEIYPCLCKGATLVLRTNEMLADLRTFFQGCLEKQLTVLDLPTAYWHQLVADLALADVAIPESLRLVIIGGEKVLPEPVRHWQQYLAKSGLSDRLQLINTYGPTETTVSATLYRISASTSSTVGEVPIGRPLPHLQAYILDPHLKPTPIGVPGEMYIGGDGLARGYLNRPELTSEKFIPNPFSDAKSERLYKTGDLARYRSDGNIEFLGRIDNQVKIRGFRIELGEIEAVLNTHPQIQQTVVIATEDIAGNKGLVAYLSILDDSLNTDLIREFLRQNLPEYMVPNAFVTLDALPLTPNGKIDRLALPAPDREITRSTEAYVKPQTEPERMIATIWQNVLQVEKVGLHDNFFDIGGHSLLLIRVHSQMREIFKQDISILEMFKYPTISSFAQYLNQEKSDHLSSLDKSNNQLEDMKEGRNRLKQRLVRLSVVNQEK